MWHSHGMTRIRISTTVDSELLDEARSYCGLEKDAVVMDAALKAFVMQRRNAAIDAAYAAAYDAHPFDEPDEWGDLISFGQAAENS
jgi:hypothetical protein